ncbi:DEKNAAC104456 [Brettanomyces naardenensis]|uniref:DEKNAAC104456 n=1 Tax=Brettanomyces naardenensis TaxID=13370 RepID=A0A448YRG5_BRENA|nr:DEKNAAC104456 [Brettanomyces naardenensis]
MSKIFNLTSQEAFKKLPQKLQTFFTRYPPAPLREYANKQTFTNAPDANPFIPNIHPVTKTVHSSIYSLRRQSDLYKLAYKFGVAELMPVMQNGKKLFTEKYETKPVLKGVTRPKGHKWERTYEERKKRVEEGIAKADDVLIQYRGSKYKKRLERRKVEQRTWY